MDKKTREEIRREDDPRGKPQGERVVGPRPSGHSHTLSGSDVLDETGTAGVQRRPMHEALRTSGDEVMQQRLGPEEGASVRFVPDPELNDAAADLADDLARGYLDSATQKTADWSEEAGGDEDVDDSEVGGPFHLDAPEEGTPDDVGDIVAAEPPEQERLEVRPARRRRPAAPA